MFSTSISIGISFLLEIRVLNCLSKWLLRSPSLGNRHSCVYLVELLAIHALIINSTLVEAEILITIAAEMVIMVTLPCMLFA